MTFGCLARNLFCAWEIHSIGSDLITRGESYRSIMSSVEDYVSRASEYSFCSSIKSAQCCKNVIAWINYVKMLVSCVKSGLAWFAFLEKNSVFRGFFGSRDGTRCSKHGIISIYYVKTLFNYVKRLGLRNLRLRGKEIHFWRIFRFTKKRVVL